MTAPLDIDQLHTFLAIVDTGSFTKAADRVFKTQSAVSMQMRRLEERIGKQLFAKDGRGNRLTAEGEIVFIEANPNPMLAREEDFAQSAMKAGLKYPNLIQQILQLGMDTERG